MADLKLVSYYSISLGSRAFGFTYPSAKDPRICTFPSRSPTSRSPACLSPSECRTLVPQASLLQPSGILARAGGLPHDPDVPDWTSWLIDQECSDLTAPPWPVSPRSLRRDLAPLPSLSSAELGLARRTGSHSESFRRADNQGLQTQTHAQNESTAGREEHQEGGGGACMHAAPLCPSARLYTAAGRGETRPLAQGHEEPALKKPF